MESITILQPHAATPISTVAVDTTSQLPSWLSKMTKRQQKLNKKYERAKGEVAQAYNELLMRIDEINENNGTSFSFSQVVNEYQGRYAHDAIDGDD